MRTLKITVWCLLILGTLSTAQTDVFALRHKEYKSEAYSESNTQQPKLMVDCSHNILGCHNSNTLQR
jgi:hypothetical protein